jgi:hypothetical protein
MNNFYNSSFQTSLSEIKNDEKKSAISGLKSVMQVIFVLSFLLLVFLAIAKARGI